MVDPHIVDPKADSQAAMAAPPAPDHAQTRCLAQKRLLRSAALALFIALPALWLAFCQPAAPTIVKLAGPTMGSTFHISYVPGPATGQPLEVQGGVQAILDEIDQAVSTYRPDSALARFNAAPAGACMDMPEAALALARHALALHQDSEGAFDVTLLPALEAWGFRHGGDEQPPPAQAPTSDELARLRQRVGMQHLRVQGGQLCKDAPIRVEFNSTAAGYAVDRVSAWLSRQGATSHLVEITGEMRASGLKPGGKPWRIAIEAPLENAVQAQKIVALRDQSLSTSGDYRNWREIGGQRQNHILDARSLTPVRHRLASVTVATESAQQADGLSTLLMALGPQAGHDYAVQRHIAALFITREAEGFSVRATPAFDAAFPATAVTGETP